MPGSGEVPTIESQGRPPRARRAWDLLRRFWPWLRREVRLAVACAGLLLLALPLGMVSPLVARHLFDEILPSGDLDRLLQTCGLMIVLTLISGAIHFGESILALRLANRILFRLARDLFAHVYRLPLAFLRQSRQGDLMSRLRDDVVAVEPLLPHKLLRVVVDLAGAVVFLGLMVYLDSGLALTGLVLVLVLCGGIYALSGPLRLRSRAAREADATASAALHEALAGFETVRTSAQDSRERRRYIRRVKDAVRKAVRRDVFGAATGASVSLILQMGIYSVLAVGAYEISQGTSSLGNLVAFFLYLVQMTTRAGSVLSLIPSAQNGFASLERLFKLLDEPAEADTTGPHGLPTLRGEVEFRDVHLTYENGQQALRGISLVANPGEMIALVGPSGSGKSTLMQLLPRLFVPQQGEVSIDGIPLERLPLRWLRSQIGVVPQDVFLFDRTIHENIAFADPDATELMIQEAADAAGATEFIKRLTKGMDTVVGERGVRLSAGEKQRIAIAREMLRKPPILIMDEATSNLDARSETLVRQAVERLRQGRTAFVIAHRLSTVQKADRILVLKEGRIVEQGGHAELLEQQGLYHELLRLQWFQEEIRERNAAGSTQES